MRNAPSRRCASRGSVPSAASTSLRACKDDSLPSAMYSAGHTWSPATSHVTRRVAGQASVALGYVAEICKPHRDRDGRLTWPLGAQTAPRPQPPPAPATTRLRQPWRPRRAARRRRRRRPRRPAPCPTWAPTAPRRAPRPRRRPWRPASTRRRRRRRRSGGCWCTWTGRQRKAAGRPCGANARGLAASMPRAGRAGSLTRSAATGAGARSSPRRSSPRCAAPA